MRACVRACVRVSVFAHAQVSQFGTVSGVWLSDAAGSSTAQPTRPVMAVRSIVEKPSPVCGVCVCVCVCVFVCMPVCVCVCVCA